MTGLPDGDSRNQAMGAEPPEVVVVGAGVSGIRAALDLAEVGHRVALIDRSPVSGGLLLSLDRQFPDDHCGFCRMLPMIDRDPVRSGCMRRGLIHERIAFSPATEVIDVQGSPGDLTVRMASWPLAVDSSRCSACGACIEACPVVLPDPDCDGLVLRKALFRAGPHVPPTHLAVDPQSCTLCGACASACPEGAITLAPAPVERTLERVAAVIMATGVQFYDPSATDVYGIGRFPDVLTSLAFERLLSTGGPTGGLLLRPSDGKPARRIAWIQCVGSRNLAIGADHCSGACCMFALKQAVLARERGSEATLFAMDLRTVGRDGQRYRDRAEALGVRLVRCRPHSIEQAGTEPALRLSYAPALGRIVDEPFDLVVLSTGRDPGHLPPNPAGRPGVLATEGASRLMDISESLISASEVACRVNTLLAKSAGASSAETSGQHEEHTRSALVVGAGPAGLSASLALAEQGVPVRLVDRGEHLGGNLRSIAQEGVRERVQALAQAVERHENIEALLGCSPVRCQGPAGFFETTVRDHQGRERVVRCATIILATGGGAISAPLDHPRVLTVFELAKMVERPGIPEPSCLVLQLCASTRQEPFNYCSRLCCPLGLETAIRARERWPAAEVVLFFRDIITPGDLEKLYTQARRAGVRFIAYEKEAPPEMVPGDERVTVTGFDPLLGEPVRFEADYLALATGLRPGSGPEIGGVFGLRSTSEGFLPEADAKWRPVDSGREGIFLCGLARHPVTADQAMIEGRAAAMRAMRLIARSTRPSSAVAHVRPALCSLCSLCRTVCPYQARYPDPEGFMAVDPLACQGCGACVTACPNGASVMMGARADLETFR
jgi:heterodisulfide reductase subunit A-like polyferredoxin